MRESARFAALSLSALLALPLLGADLRTLKEPAKIAGVFPAGAKLRVRDDAAKPLILGNLDSQELACALCKRTSRP